MRLDQLLLPAQFLRLPDDSAAALSRDEKKRHPAAGRDGRGRGSRLDPTDCRMRAAVTANFQAVHQLSLEEANCPPESVSRSQRRRNCAATKAEFAQKGLTMERNRDLRIGINGWKAEVDSCSSASVFSSRRPIPRTCSRESLCASERRRTRGVTTRGGRVWRSDLSGDRRATSALTIKVGEASLRIAQQINPLATPYNRPVSDLKVTLT